MAIADLCGLNHGQRDLWSGHGIGAEGAETDGGNSGAGVEGTIGDYVLKRE
jgi:hypothetical protein